jgi:hypothetical protein
VLSARLRAPMRRDQPQRSGRDLTDREHHDRKHSDYALEAQVTGPTISRGTRLVRRRHIDLQRVSSAICRTFC